MTTVGQLIAKPPASPYANLTATTRTGINPNRSAVWQLSCLCGESVSADAQAIKRGAARCPTCNPRRGMEAAKAVLAVLPAGYAKIVRKTKLSPKKIRYTLELMRKAGLCHIGGWARAEDRGSLGPVIHAGPGQDVPCKLKALTQRQYECRYRKRLQRAIQQADAGKEDARYSRRISLHKADQTVRRTLVEPQTPFSALFVGVRIPLNVEG